MLHPTQGPKIGVVDRTRRLTNYWSWLPAFRAVAETEHLPTAAEQMYLSASALSRSVKQLEDYLGVELFERHGRRMVLSSRGRVLLEHVRKAMRLVDDGVGSILAEQRTGVLRIVTPGPFASLYVLPAIQRLREEHPGLVPVVLSGSGSGVNQGLLAGEIDLALIDDPVADEDLEVEKVVDVPYGVYCGPGHPLYEAPTPGRDEILEHGFAGPPGGAYDHFPPEVPRKMNVELGQLQLGVELCASGLSLAVLPDPVAARQPELRKLPFEGIEPAALFAVYRRPLSQFSDALMMLSLIRAEIDRAGAGA